MLSETCTCTKGWDNEPQNKSTPFIASYAKPSSLAAPPPPSNISKYILNRPLDVLLDNTSYATIVPYVGSTIVQGNEISNSTTIQIYGCGFNVIFAGNKITAMHVTEKCIGSSGIAIFGIHYQVAQGESVIKYKSSLNVLKDTYDYSCY